MKLKKRKSKTGKRRSSHEAPRFEQEMQKASQLLQGGNLHQAAGIYRDILRQSPTHAAALHMLGMVYAEAGELGAAVELMRQSVQADPQNPEYRFRLAGAFFRLGEALFAQGKREEALGCFQQALQYDPDYADAAYNIGVIYAGQGRMEEAAAAYQKALDIGPGNPAAYCGLGKAKGELGELDEAVRCFQEALRYDPQYAEAYYNLGVLYNTHDKMAEAIASYQQSLAIRPDYTIAYCALAKLKKFSRADELVADMEQLFTRPGLTGEQRMYLAFSLGKALEDCQEYEKAFDYLREGNRLKRQSYDYSVAETRAEFGRIKKIFTPSFVSQQQDKGNPDGTPIFILGMPRSGTSLVEQILASHPDVYGAGELRHVRDLVLQLGNTRQVGDAVEKIAAEAGSLIPRFAAAYLEKLKGYAENARHITDKMPHNFVFLGLIRLALPQAKIIHCVREPMDNCFSIYKQLFTGEHKYAYDLEELGRYYLLYRDLMQHWRELFPGTIYDIGYEALVEDQEGETRKLLQHCGLAWDDGCLRFYETARKVTTASLAQVRKPIYKNAVQRWRHYERQLQPLTAVLAGDGGQAG